MSQEKDLAFLRKIAENDELHAKFMKLVRESGYEFEVDELSDDDLEKAAGGIDLISTQTVDYKFSTLQTIAGKMDYTDLLAYKEQIFF